MESKDLQIEILLNSIAGLYKDLAELKAELIIVSREKEQLEKEKPE